MPAQKFNFNFAPAEEEDYDEEGEVEEEMIGVSIVPQSCLYGLM